MSNSESIIPFHRIHHSISPVPYILGMEINQCDRTPLIIMIKQFIIIGNGT